MNDSFNTFAAIVGFILIPGLLLVFVTLPYSLVFRSKRATYPVRIRWSIATAVPLLLALQLDTAFKIIGISHMVSVFSARLIVLILFLVSVVICIKFRSKYKVNNPGN